MSRGTRYDNETSIYRPLLTQRSSDGARSTQIATHISGWIHWILLHSQTPWYLSGITCHILCALPHPDPPLKEGACGFLVGVRGLEPPTSASRTLRASRLRYTPLNLHASDSLHLPAKLSYASGLNRRSV